MFKLFKTLFLIHLLLILNLNILTGSLSISSASTFGEDQNSNSTTDPDLSNSSDTNTSEKSESNPTPNDDLCLSILTPFKLINKAQLLYEVNGLLSKAPNPTLGTIVPPPEFS